MYSENLEKKVDFNLQSTVAIYEFHEPSFVNKLQKGKNSSDFRGTWLCNVTENRFILITKLLGSFQSDV